MSDSISKERVLKTQPKTVKDSNGDYIIDLSEIKEFDFEKVVDHYTAIFLARRRSGKSVLLRNMLYIHQKKQKRFHDAYLFSETASLQPKVNDYFPSSHRFDGFDDERLGQIIDAQESLVLENFKCEKKFKSENNILIVLDDCINDPKIRSSKNLSRLFVSGRHLKISVIILSQSFSSKAGISKVCMDNSDLIVCFTIFAKYDRELITDKYMSIFDDTKYSRALVNRIALEKPYQCMVLDTSLTTIKETSDYVYKSCLPVCTKKFMIGKDKVDNYDNIGSQEVKKRIKRLNDPVIKLRNIPVTNFQRSKERKDLGTFSFPKNFKPLF